MELRNFDDCIAETNGKCHLMLGNGFSISLFPEIFNYSKLRNVIQEKGLQDFFDAFNTNDFEYVMRKILDSTEVVKILDPQNNNLLNALKDKYDELSTALIEAVTSSHPENPSHITEAQYKSCINFLGKFQKKYTFNYDLILYWVHMHSLNSTLELDSNDGFGKHKKEDANVLWEIGNEGTQNIYYLHGALHIFSNGSYIEKYTWNNTNTSIVKQVKESLQAHKLPIFVAEGTKDHKTERIYNNGYLARSFSSLKSIGGSLFIFGHSLRDEDDHVFDVILKRNTSLKNIYISIYGSLDSPENKKILDKIRKWKDAYEKKKHFDIVDASTVHVWDLDVNSKKD